MAGPETLSDKPKPDTAKTSAKADDAASYVGTPAVGTSKAAAAAGLPTVGGRPSLRPCRLAAGAHKDAPTPSGHADLNTPATS